MKRKFASNMVIYDYNIQSLSLGRNVMSIFNKIITCPGKADNLIHLMILINRFSLGIFFSTCTKKSRQYEQKQYWGELNKVMSSTTLSQGNTKKTE